MHSIFALPNELLIASLSSQFPCRNEQIRALATLLTIQAAPTRNIVLYGLEATGKSAITKGWLEAATHDPDRDTDSLRYAIVKSAECITARHLLEATIGEVARAVGWKQNIRRCENLPQLVVGLAEFLEFWVGKKGYAGKRFVLVFDGIDKQRESLPTLLPALARLGEILPNLTVVFIVSAPRPNFLHLPGVPHIHFPLYTKEQCMTILSTTPPSPALPSGPEQTQDVYGRFCSAVWDSLSKHSGRDILSLRAVCNRLWPKFVRPIFEGTHLASQFSKLLVANRPLFQNERALLPNIVSNAIETPLPTTTTTQTTKAHGIATQLPYYSRLLLVAAYLASFNPPRTDQLFFMKAAAAKRRKKGGGTALTRGRPGVTKHRKISRKLLGPQAFVLERLFAIFHAIKEDANGRRGAENVAGSADLQMAVATLASLKLLVKMGAANAADTLDGGSKYRVAIGWEVVRGIARSVGLEAEDYLAE